MISQADWIIDMGLGGGSEDGEVLFTGTPEQLLTCEKSRTAKYLKSAIE